VYLDLIKGYKVTIGGCNAPLKEHRKSAGLGEYCHPIVVAPKRGPTRVHVRNWSPKTIHSTLCGHPCTGLATAGSPYH